MFLAFVFLVPIFSTLFCFVFGIVIILDMPEKNSFVVRGDQVLGSREKIDA